VSTETTQTPSTRTFWKSDYRKAAKLVKGMRHLRCQASTPKPDLQMGRVDSLAAAISQYFEADAPEGAFSAEKFLAGTQLPQAQSCEDTEDDPDEDEGDAGHDEDTGNTLPDSPPAE
jgi:hypothetical protein